MKKNLLLALCLIALLPLSLMAETMPATDSRATFVGRAIVEDGSLRFDWPSTYFRVAFTGKSLSMRVSDNKRNFYAVWVYGYISMAHTDRAFYGRGNSARNDG